MTQKPARKSPSSPLRVVGTGLIALDAVTSADDSVPVRYWAGGTCGNVLIALSYLGWSARPVARLANDSATELLLKDLRRWRVSNRFIRVEADGSTPIIVHRIKRDANGRVDHSFSWRCTSCGSRYPGYKAELLTVAEKIASRLHHTKVFFFDRVSAAALELARAARENGALVAFEPSSIGNPILFRQAWEIAHVVKYSHQRLNDFPEMDVETSPCLVIETLGDAGLRYRWRRPGKRLSTWVDSKAIQVDDVRDTAGAGDWCTAGLLSRVAATGYEGFSNATDEQISEAIKFGQALAAWNCRFEGARGGMYAVSKPDFQKQIKEILSGSSKVIPVGEDSTTNFRNPGVVCRVCEHSASHDKKARKAK